MFHLSIVLNHYSELRHSLCYTAQPFSADVQCLAIFHCYRAQPFANGYSELSHFCYNHQSFYDFVSHSQDPISHFATMPNHFAKLLSHFQVSVSHSLE
jgi:hypothetical protein